jgi:hypothetical protein
MSVTCLEKAKLTDRQTTALLTKVGFLMLKKMGCYAISTEIKLTMRDHLLHDADKHYIIDVLGVSKKYIPYKEQKNEKVKYGEVEYDQKIKFNNILRGFEIKVSRSDFKNGFIHTGCNYNYLLIPKGLIEHSEVSSSVGIIEVDLDNLLVEYPHYVTMENQGFHLHGIKVSRNARFNRIEDWVVDSCYRQIAETLTNQTKRWLVQELAPNSLLHAQPISEAKL